MREYRLRIKLLLSDRVAGFCYVVSAVVMLIVLLGLYNAAEERSAVPIGVVCLDASDEAASLCALLDDNDAFYCMTGDADSLLELMKDGYVNSIFVIPEGYGERVRAGEIRELISITSVEDDRISVLASDIVAGCMMHDICVSKAFNRYKQLSDAVCDRETFTQRIIDLENDPQFTYAFDMSFVDRGTGQTDIRSISNSILYREAIGCLLALLMSLLTFCSCNGIASEHGSGISQRKRIGPFCRIAGGIREIAAVYTFVLPAGLLAAIMTGLGRPLMTVAALFGINALFIMISVVFYYLCAKAAGGIFTYQLLGTATVVLFGAAGFASIITGLLGNEMFGSSPYAVFVHAVTAYI